MVKARVRGIYTTAITSLLLDNGFKIVQPSTTIRERFKLSGASEDNCQPDLDVNDRFDKQGVNVVGDTASVEEFTSLLFDTFSDVIIRRRLSTFTQISGIEDSLTDLVITAGNALREDWDLAAKRRILIDVEFPSESKKKLDEIRCKVVPTLSGHHYYKACGGKIAYMLEMAEKMLEKGCILKDVETLFKETIRREYPCEGLRTRIEHVKIDGKIFDLGEAYITMFDEQDQQIRLLRTFSTPGLYDGLKIQKEPGDYAVTNMRISEWTFKTSYFSRYGNYKGTYVNINTPIEMYPTKIRYVDLEVDICMWPDGKIQEMDREKLNLMVHKGYVSRRLEQIVYEKIRQTLNSLSPDIEKEAPYAND